MGEGLAAACAAAVVLLGAREARANAPEFVAALTGKAADQWQAACATATTTGSACSTTICGAEIAIDPGGNPTSRNLLINGTQYNLHEVTTNRTDIAAAALLNALCSAGGGDPFVASAGSFALQGQQIEAFTARAGARYGARAAGGQMPVSVLSVGGSYERGAGSSNGFLLPISYARNLSETQFVNLSGSLVYATRGEGSPQPDGRVVPGLRQLALALTPSYGMEKRRDDLTFALGGYVPISYASASVVGTDQSLSSYSLGVGGIGTATAQVGGAVLSGGAAFSARKTGGALTVPITALVRAVRPLSVLFDGYASINYGHDPVGAKTGLLTVAAGVSSGNTELGLRGFLGGDYRALLLGFTYRRELEGSFAIQKPADPEPRPADPAP